MPVVGVELMLCFNRSSKPVCKVLYMGVNHWYKALEKNLGRKCVYQCFCCSFTNSKQKVISPDPYHCHSLRSLSEFFQIPSVTSRRCTCSDTVVVEKDKILLRFIKILIIGYQTFKQDGY